MTLLGAVIRETRRLHELALVGRGDSPEAEAIRDGLDGPWAAMDDAGRDAATRYSAGLALAEAERSRLAALAERSGAKGALAGHLEEFILQT